MSALALAFGSRLFGHGRWVEAVLTGICTVYGIGLFIWPSLALDSKATVDLYWQGYGRIIALPFMLKALFSGWGLAANINAWPHSQSLRVYGALVGSFIWAGMFYKFAEFGAPFSFGSICCMAFLICSIRIVAMAWANLPNPGAPGAI